MLVALNRLKTFLSRYFDVDYFLRFFILLAVLYYFSLFYIAIIDKNGRFYSSFLDENLNYISWIRNSVLYTSNFIANMIGVDSHVRPPFFIVAPNGSIVEMVYACLGIGLMSFWLAFVLASPDAFKKKIAWCIVGLVCIWFINSWRVALITVALEKHWKINANMDHHMLFNIVAYTLMLVLIWLYTKGTGRSVLKVQTVSPSL
jgi:exosortase/archaeosortase family protein